MCECKCSCSCDDFSVGDVINHPEEFQLSHQNWTATPIQLIKGTCGANAVPRYHVIYKAENGITFTTTVHETEFKDKFRRIPKWDPEVGKLYYASNFPKTIAPTKYIRAFLRMAGGKYCCEVPGGVSEEFAYCWPIDAKELGK